MTENEASAKNAAGMKGMSTRKKVRAGHADQLADSDRAEKMKARKERLAEGTASEADLVASPVPDLNPSVRAHA